MKGKEGILNRFKSILGRFKQWLVKRSRFFWAVAGGVAVALVLLAYAGFLQLQTNDLQTANANLGTEKSSLKSQIIGLQADKNRLEREKTGLQGQMSDLKSVPKEENDLGPSLQTAVESLKTANENLEKERARSQSIQKDLIAVKAENLKLAGRVEELFKENGALKEGNPALVKEIGDLRAEVARLSTALKNANDKLALAGKASLATVTSPTFPPGPVSSELADWSWEEAMKLLRITFPGTDMYRAPIFSRGLVPSLAWYQETITKVPAGVLDKPFPGRFMGWFAMGYEGAITGYAVAQKIGGSGNEVYKVVAAHDNGKIGIYYLVDGMWTKAGGAGDTITPRVRAVNMIE